MKNPYYYMRLIVSALITPNNDVAVRLGITTGEHSELYANWVLAKARLQRAKKASAEAKETLLTVLARDVHLNQIAELIEDE